MPSPDPGAEAEESPVQEQLPGGTHGRTGSGKEAGTLGLCGHGMDPRHFQQCRGGTKSIEIVQ